MPIADLPAPTAFRTRTSLFSARALSGLLGLLLVLACKGSGTPDAPLSVTGFAPAYGAVGSLVTVTGANFDFATTVTFGGVPAPGVIVSADQESLSVPVPAQAATGELQLQTSSVTVAVPGGPFTVVPSRSAAFTQPVVTSSGLFGEGTYLDFPQLMRTAQYASLFPTTPMFHAYNPDAGGEGRNPYGTTLTLNLKLPIAFFETLPQAIQDQVSTLGIPPANVDIFVMSENYFYDGVTPNDGIYLFRPQYWIDPTAPYEGTTSSSFAVSAAFYEPDGPITVDGNAPGVWFNFDVSVHSEIPGALSPMISSGNTQPVAGLDVTRSTSLWSLTQYGQRAAATLHLLFNDSDQAVLSGLANTTQDLAGLNQAFSSSALSTARGIGLFRMLMRPLINQLLSIPNGTGNQMVTLTGSCLTGTLGVTLNGKPVTGWQLLSDNQLQLILPATDGGSLVVTTPMGVSDPVILPTFRP